MSLTSLFDHVQGAVSDEVVAQLRLPVVLGVKGPQVDGSVGG